jgi:pyruvate,water dikinase
METKSLSEDATKQGRELPIPEDFPVVWESDEEKALLWRWDNIHSPLPSSPMTDSLWDAGVWAGAAEASKELGRSGRNLRRRINGFSYSATPSDPQDKAQKATQHAAMHRAVARTRRRWDREFLPAIERDLARMRGTDLDSATDSDLLEHLDESLKLHTTHWYYHFLVVSPLSVAVERMATLYREAMGSVPDEEPYVLLQGIDNKSLETDREIRRLAGVARDNSTVTHLFSQWSSDGSLMDSLAGEPECSGFLKELESFLAVYGYRPTGFDYVYPAWIEDPSFVLLMIKSCLASPPASLEDERAAGATEAAKLLDRALAKLEDDDEKRREFLAAYELARELWPLKEDHSFYIDQGSTASLRMIIAEMGRRLVRMGVLESAERVFFLTLDEVKAALAGKPTGDLAGLAQRRFDQRERFMSVVPPQFIGTMPADSSSVTAPEFRRMVGPTPDSRSDDRSTVLRGVPGSKGKATGPAKIVRGPDEFHTVRPGDVLVCTSTNPTWTALFGSVAGLVSDSGGVLSHTAIVAREYGLPAVVGVGRGTSAIDNGQVVTVDGSSGVVLLR